MTPKKEQVDWKIGIKQCPCGQPNHLHETHCVRCGASRLPAPAARRPFRTRRLFRFALLTTLAIYLTFYLSSPTISLQQSTALAQTTKANLETVENQLLALTTALSWRIIGFIEEISAQDWTLTLETKTQELARQLANRNDNKTQADPTSDPNEAQVHRTPRADCQPNADTYPYPHQDHYRQGARRPCSAGQRSHRTRNELRHHRQGPGRRPAGRNSRRIGRMVQILLRGRRHTRLVAQQPRYRIPHRRRTAPAPQRRPLLPEISGCTRHTDSGP